MLTSRVEAIAKSSQHLAQALLLLLLLLLNKKIMSGVSLRTKC